MLFNVNLGVCFSDSLCGYGERAKLYQLGLVKEVSYYRIVEIYHLLWESYCEIVYILL